MSSETSTFTTEIEIADIPPISSPPFFWDHLLQRLSGAPGKRHFFPPLPLAIKCCHGIELFSNPTAEVVEAMSSSDIEDIMKFMPAFHDALKSRFPNASSALNQNDSIEEIGRELMRELMQSIIDSNNTDIVPDVTDPIYIKVVTACLSALGTEYLLHARVNDNQKKKRYTSMGAVIAYVAAMFTHDVDAALLLSYAENKGDLEDCAALVLNLKNACNCLKKEEEGEGENKCAYCNQSEEKLFQCTGCRSVKYCGKSCQRSDWTNHKTVCKGKRKSAK